MLRGRRHLTARYGSASASNNMREREYHDLQICFVFRQDEVPLPVLEEGALEREVGEDVPQVEHRLEEKPRACEGRA